MNMYQEAMYGDSSPILLYILIALLLWQAFKHGGIGVVFKVILCLIAIWFMFVAGMTSLILVFANFHYIFVGAIFIFIAYCLIFRRK
jgi:hypothetical protein